MNDNIVRQLISGSQNIDRMRKEIDFVVKMVLGMINSHDIYVWTAKTKPGYSHTASFEDSFNCCWEIRLLKNSDSQDGEFTVTCDLIFSTVQENRESRALGAYKNRHPAEVELRYVQRVHEALPTFITGMAYTFPTLKKTWRPFLDAADMKI